jgi:predicted ATPase/DNA-binding SARP family transcriptional activator
VTAAALPVSLTTFVGRSRELDDVVRLLRGTRLLTLIGAGGSGKTRLAMAAAGRLAHDFRTVAWVELGPLADAGLLETAVLTAAGVGERGVRSSIAAITEALADGPSLFVLDNCEHLINPCVELAETLLRNCPSLSILATSREPLGTAAEITWLVPPLGLQEEGPGGRGAPTEAVQLFVERAKAVVPAFTLTDSNAAAVGEICRRLDGLPLAIELAAARLRVLTPEQIAERLHDSFHVLGAGPRTSLTRHRTLQAVIDWSHDLLPPAERLLLARLSVFAGTFDLTAAEVVCTDSTIPVTAVLDLLAGLVGKSLVETSATGGTARYRLLETVRQYAAKKLAESGEEGVTRRRHAMHFAGITNAARFGLLSSARPEWISRLAAERDNLYAAIAWTRDADTELHLRLVGDLPMFWSALGLAADARRWAEDALRLPGAERPTEGRASALSCAGFIAAQQGHSGAARGWLEEAARLWAELGDARAEAYALNYLGSALMLADPHAGERVLRRTREVFHSIEDRFGEAMALNSLAVCLQGMGELDAAIDAAAAAATLAREDGAAGTLAIALLVLGAALYLGGSPARAMSQLEEAASHFRQAIHPAVARLLELYAAALAQLDHGADAAIALGAADGVRKRMGMAPAAQEPAPWGQIPTPVRALLADGRLVQAWREGTGLDTTEALDWVHARAAGAAGRQPRAGDTSPAAGGTSPAALRVQALGPLIIDHCGRVLPAEAWGSARPRELLLYLLMHPHGCTREQVGLALWPEASAGQVRNSFHTTLHRLRKVLGDNVSVAFAGDRYRLDVVGGVEFDVPTFERDVNAALAALGTDSGAADRLATALGLYRGGFLEGEPVGDWHLEVRDRMERLQRTALGALAEAWMDDARYDEARAVLQRLVYADELNEHAHRQLMTCLARSGERAQAIRVFQRLASVLDEELSVEPEAATLALAQRLQGGKDI